jgi:hypothetical protein
MADEPRHDSSTQQHITDAEIISQFEHALKTEADRKTFRQLVQDGVAPRQAAIQAMQQRNRQKTVNTANRTAEEQRVNARAAATRAAYEAEMPNTTVGKAALPKPDARDEVLAGIDKAEAERLQRAAALAVPSTVIPKQPKPNPTAQKQSEQTSRARAHSFARNSTVLRSPYLDPYDIPSPDEIKTYTLERAEALKKEIIPLLYEELNKVGQGFGGLGWVGSALGQGLGSIGRAITRGNPNVKTDSINEEDILVGGRGKYSRATVQLADALIACNTVIQSETRLQHEVSLKGYTAKELNDWNLMNPDQLITVMEGIIVEIRNGYESGIGEQELEAKYDKKLEAVLEVFIKKIEPILKARQR